MAMIYVLAALWACPVQGVLGSTCSTGHVRKLGVAHDCDDRAPGEACTARAAPGFEYVAGGGPTVLRCGADGQLSGPLPQLGAQECGVPALPEGATHTCAGTSVGESCWVYCGGGSSGPPAQYECTAAGDGGRAVLVPVEAPAACSATEGRRLEPAGPARRLSVCDDSIVFLGFNAPQYDHDCTGKGEGERCIVHCASGYDGLGLATVYECVGDNNANQGFSYVPVDQAGTLPVCTPQVCTYSLPYGAGVTHDCDGKVTGETCTANCSAGYIPLVDPSTNSTTLACETFVCMGRAFNGTSPLCAAQSCEISDELAAYDATSCSGRTSGSWCVVMCPAPLIGTPQLFACSATTGIFCPYDATQTLSFTCMSGSGDTVLNQSFSCASAPRREELSCSDPAIEPPPPPPPGNFSLASCPAHPQCSRLAGECCPTTSGTRLSCCTQPYTTYVRECSAHEECSGLSGSCCPTLDGINLACCSNVTYTAPWTALSLVFRLGESLSRRLTGGSGDSVEQAVRRALATLHSVSVDQIEIVNVLALANSLYDVSYAVELGDGAAPVIDADFESRFAGLASVELSNQSVQVVQFEALGREETNETSTTTGPAEGPQETTTDQFVNRGRVCRVSAGTAVAALLIALLSSA